MIKILFSGCLLGELVKYHGTPTRLKPMGILNYLKKVILGLLANS